MLCSLEDYLHQTFGLSGFLAEMTFITSQDSYST